MEVIGHHYTVSRLENYLAETIINGTDTFIARLREIPVIRTELWDKVNDTEVIGQLAQAEIDFLQGLTKLSGGASPLVIGTVFEMGPNDEIIKQVSKSSNSVYCISKTGDPSSIFRHRMDVIRQNDALTGAVIELSGQADWIKIYKAIEYIEEYFGGERDLGNAFPNKKSALKRIKRTAQSVRHRGRAFENIIRPYKLEDAEKFLQTIIHEIVDDAKKIDQKPLVPKFTINKPNYHPDYKIASKPKILVNGEVSDVAYVGDTLTFIESDKED